MSNNPIFQYITDGSYPNENYNIKPLINEVFDWTNISYPYIFRHYLNHHKNPLKKVLDQSQPAFNTYITLSGIYFNENPYPIDITSTVSNNNIRFIENVKSINFDTEVNAISIAVSASQLRMDYNYPHSFYFLYFLDPNSNTSNGFILYPEQLFIKPTGLSYDNSTKQWNLNTSLVTLSNSTVSLSSSNIEKDAYISHRQRLSSLPTNDVTSLVNLQATTDYEMNISVYGSNMRYDYPIVTHSTVTPTKIINTIDANNNIAYIYPNSTFVTFSADYIDITDQTPGLSLAQFHQSVDHNNIPQTFNPTFISKLSGLVDAFEVFQLIQDLTSTTNTEVKLSDFSNSIYYVNITNGATATFTLSANPNAKLKVVKNSYIGFNYIADCYKLINVLTKTKPYAKDTCTVKTNGNSPILLDNFLSLHNAVGLKNNFITTYPPHVYSYKTQLKNKNTNKVVDSSTLNFYLKLSTINNGTSSIQLSAYIASDFNALTYSFTPEMYTDKISYQVLGTSLSSIDTFINSVSCVYGPYNTKIAGNKILTKSNQPSIYLPVLSGKDFTIIYDKDNLQSISCVIKASLNTAAGILDQYEPVIINFNISDIVGYDIFLNIMNEKSNSISLDSSFNINLSAWPYVDLTDNNITWDWNVNGNKPADIADNISFNYIDSNGNYISQVDVGNPVLFSNTTQIVNVSGYGPNEIEITLKSDGYGTASLSTNPDLFNYLENGKFIVTPLIDLNNLNLTRTIQLKAQIPFGTKNYDIPESIPINWTWTYDGISDFDSIPITVNQLNNNSDYLYSSNYAASALSAIQVNVTPGYSDSVPTIHEVTVTATTDTTSPPTSGSYTFHVDDFPDPSIFNADFQSYYYSNSSPDQKIADTSTENNIITRPDDSYLHFQFIAYPIDSAKNIKCDRVKWTVNDNPVSDTPNNTSGYLYNLDFPSNKSLLLSYTSYGYAITSAKIGFSLIEATALNWISAHNVSAYTYVYILSSNDFYTPLDFIIYPEYAWLSNDQTHVTLLSSNPSDPSYFTNSFRPSAYGNKISNSQTFWVSANKSCFDEYFYQNLNNNNIVQSSSSFSLIDMPYNFNNSITSIPISLVAYNSSFYPESFIGDSYLIYRNNNFYTEYYNLTAKTKDLPESHDTVYGNFYLSPCILPYNDINLDYNLIQTNIELDNNPNISVTQILKDSDNGPAIILAGSTITYYLSNQYWTASATVSAINGTFSLFDLILGDPASPLHCGDGLNPVDSFNIYAETNILQQIPSSTFDNYLNTNQYPLNPNLWNTLSGI